MIRACLLYLLIVALWSTAFSVVAFVGGHETDCYTAALVAILAFGGVFALGYLEDELDRHIRDERARTWARRDRETGL